MKINLEFSIRAYSKNVHNITRYNMRTFFWLKFVQRKFESRIEYSSEESVPDSIIFNLQLIKPNFAIFGELHSIKNELCLRPHQWHSIIWLLYDFYGRDREPLCCTFGRFWNVSSTLLAVQFSPAHSFIGLHSSLKSHCCGRIPKWKFRHGVVYSCNVKPRFNYESRTRTWPNKRENYTV